MKSTTNTTESNAIEAVSSKEVKRGSKSKSKERTKHKGIKRLPDGRYLVRVRVQDPKTGEEIDREETVEGGIQDAVKVQEELRSAAFQPAPQSEPMTLGDCAKLWLAQCTKDGDAQSTLDARIQILEHHILPHLGKYLVQRIDRHDLQEWVRAVSAETKPNGERYSEETFKGWWRALRALLRWTVEELDLPADPTSRFDPKRYVHRQLRRGVQRRRERTRSRRKSSGHFWRR